MHRDFDELKTNEMENIEIDSIIKEAEEEIRAFERCSKVVSLKLIDALKQIKNHGGIGHVIGSVLSKAEMQIVLPLIERKFEDTPEGSMTHHELEHLLDRIK